MKLNHKVSRINRDAFLIEETLTDGISSATLCQRNLIVEREKMLEKTILTVMDDEQLERLKSNVEDELTKRKKRIEDEKGLCSRGNKCKQS